MNGPFRESASAAGAAVAWRTVWVPRIPAPGLSRALTEGQPGRSLAERLERELGVRDYQARGRAAGAGDATAQDIKKAKDNVANPLRRIKCYQDAVDDDPVD